ncbi:hypothetical protein [Microbacterium thalli]|uniref:hypothetical protein n=1 Tax=Microbacterium thalli TaxID=3027921 RepID=UPI002365B816|nr:hypothetical protein [Microbacterium thalli]MDD7930074.1 hypothetical protein [Microbacterium thalli]
MSKVREDLEGTVHAINQARERVILKAGDKIPAGYFVGGHAVEGGDVKNQTPPWTSTGTTASASAASTEQGAGREPESLPDVLDRLVADGAEPQELLEQVAAHFEIELHGAPEGDGGGSDEDAPLVVPPKAGAGSGADVWRAYAVEAAKRAGLKIAFDDAASRGDIIAALDDAKIATE